MTAAQAIVRGLAPDGGLMTPEVLPRLPGSALETMRDMSYQQRVVYVLSRFLDEFSARELTAFAAAAYGGNFDTPAVAPVRPLQDGLYCLELWHGPTCAFKDMALQMLPHLLSASLTKIDEEKTACVLVARYGIRLARFSTPEQALFCTRMIAGSGGAVCALVAGLGGYLFIRAGRRTHKEDCCDAGKS